MHAAACIELCNCVSVVWIALSGTLSPTPKNAGESSLFIGLCVFTSLAARVRSVVVSVSVCLSVCSHISKTTRPNFTNFLYMIPVAVARDCSYDSEIRYVLPVLWMTSLFSHNAAYDGGLTAKGCQSGGGNAKGRRFSTSAPPAAVCNVSSPASSEVCSFKCGGILR